tara:strand:+ start:157 stop:1716 length:1560 start_codon:yes stop_codon:yes gene_type:complete
MDFKNRAFEINNLINQNKLIEAQKKCESLVKKIPDNSYLQNLLGLIFQNQGKIKKSIIFFQKAISLENQNYAAINNLANSYRKLYQFKSAEDLYKEIIKNNPKNIIALNNYANLKRELNQYTKAKDLFLLALEIDPNNVNIMINLVTCLQGLSETNEAKNYLMKILKIQPTNTTAHRLLSSIFNYKNDTYHLKQMQDLKKNEKFKNFSLSQKTELFFALGKAYEDIEEYKKSFDNLEQANSLLNQNTNLDIENTKKFFTNLTKLFDSLEFKDRNRIDGKNKNIFICGMPRSGTTLVEQIVAAHSSVSGAGEIHYLSKIIEDNFVNDVNFDKSKILNETNRSNNLLYKQYNSLIDFHNFENNIITDKAPQNFIWIGFIKLFFPNSKIIHCNRNPKDNCLSIFKNYFTSRTMSWANDQKNIANYYLLYSKLMNYWNTRFKEDIYDANYEKLVNSPIEETKKLISFCDLEWEDQCLDFYKLKKTPVQTVSISQADKPIYKSSLNSSEGFSEYLDEMFGMLDA